MKNERTSEIRRVHDVRARLESFNFTKRLVRLLRDLEHSQCWKYGQLSPVQLLKELKVDECRADKDELARAEYFWNRRPRLLPGRTPSCHISDRLPSVPDRTRFGESAEAQKYSATQLRTKVPS
jgi:hypothetical protein